jgi:hypothetical protein
MRDCVKRIIEQSGGKLRMKEAKQIVRDVEAQAERRANETGMDYDDAIDEVIRERIANVEANIITFTRQF